jgi:hypothetical protein
MRDTSGIFTVERYDELVRANDASIVEGIAVLNSHGGSKNPDYAGQYAYQQFLYAFERVRCMYSRGDPSADMRAYFPKVIELMQWAYEHYETKFYTPDILEYRKRFRLNFDRYVLCLWLVSFTIGLDIDLALQRRLLALIGYEGEDALFDRLVAQQHPERKIGPALLYPRVFQPLYDALDAPESKRSTLLVRYVSKWYGKMKRAHWHDTHLGKDGGGYIGYWCFEVAGVVKAFKLDDQAIRDLAYYPADLVHT